MQKPKSRQTTREQEAVLRFDSCLLCTVYATLLWELEENDCKSKFELLVVLEVFSLLKWALIHLLRHEYSRVGKQT